MTVSRHISIDDEHYEKIRTYVQKNNGRIGDALREIIDLSEKYSSRRNSSVMDSSLFNWMLKEMDGILVPDSVLDEFIDPALMRSMSKLEEFLKIRFAEFDWDIDLVLKSDNDSYPSRVLIEIRGEDQKIRLASSILSQYLVKNSLGQIPLEIRSIINYKSCIKVELFRSSKIEAQRSLLSFFGKMDEIVRVIKSRPSFWKSIISSHLSSNYRMVTLHRNYFEDLLADKIPADETMIETLAKKPIQEIPLKDLLFLLKEIYENSRVIDEVNIDNDTILLFHSYRSKEAVRRLQNSFIALLEANGHLYEAKSTSNMIMLVHRPDVGIRINEIVDNMKKSESRVDQELLMFIAFLKGLKEIPDIPVSLTALGRRIGISLMKEYGKENNIRDWNLENFQKAMEMIDTKIHRESEWKLDGKNLLYTIRRCSIARDGNIFDSYICHVARETFKGSMNYAFGNRARLEIKRLLSHGDNFCEVIIQIP